MPDLRTVHVPALCLLLAAPAIGQTTTRDSLSSAGVQDPNWGSFTPVLSQDGRYLAFSSGSPNLVPGDTNNMSDIFCRDRVTGQTTRVSVSSAGAQGNGNSLDPDISADGRFVVFRSAASNLVPGDTNNAPDIFCHDRLTGTTTRVSVGTGGQQITLHSDGGAISGDGRYVVFESADNQITTGDWCLNTDVFCHDRQTGVTTLISASLIAFQQFNARLRPNISFDGSVISFDSAGDDLTLNDTNGWSDVFVWSRLTNSISRVSIASSGAEGNERSEDAVVSANGRFVAFTSFVFNFVPGDNNSPDVFVRDLQTGQLTWCSSGLAGAFANQACYVSSISGDGRFVTFWSGATNLVSGDTNGVWDVFVFDQALGTTTRVSVGTTGTQGNGQSNGGRISPDGRCIAFQSAATNLVVPDANLAAQDV
ncbi:MAG: PD40 domain-containing protein [Planctomycetes bacterium]|nr:PD40 domain-containing protein [Planctomycetota bacterium]